jgi:hypothetical protein
LSVIGITGKSEIEPMEIRLDDRTPHNSRKTLEGLNEFQIILLSYPPYSPDISSSDFSSFRWGTNAIRGQQLQSLEAV